MKNKVLLSILIIYIILNVIGYLKLVSIRKNTEKETETAGNGNSPNQK